MVNYRGRETRRVLCVMAPYLAIALTSALTPICAHAAIPTWDPLAAGEVFVAVGVRVGWPAPVTIAAAFLAPRVRDAKKQREAAYVIGALGGVVEYNCQFDEFDATKNETPLGPVWVRKLLGDDLISSVNFAVLTSDAQLEYVRMLPRLRWLSLKVNERSITEEEVFWRLVASNVRPMRSELTRLGAQEANQRITDAGLKHVGGLNRLETLVLRRTQVTDDGLRSIEALAQLRTLQIIDARIGDAGMDRIARLTRLESLSLERTRLSDAGLVKLESLPKIVGLNLADTNITDVGLKSVAEMRTLQGLVLDGTKISAAGLEQLGGLPKLRSLSLNRTSITDSGLRHLRALPKLKSLAIGYSRVTGQGLVCLQGLTEVSLEGADVTDASLDFLRQLPKLVCVNLRNTKIAAEAVRRLEQSLPKCEILFGKKALRETRKPESR